MVMDQSLGLCKWDLSHLIPHCQHEHHDIYMSENITLTRHMSAKLRRIQFIYNGLTPDILYGHMGKTLSEGQKLNKRQLRVNELGGE